jgi:hypothetical protein
MKQYTKVTGDKWDFGNFYEQTGSEFYSMLVDIFKDPKKVSERLKSEGISGNKYLGDNNTVNYVLFDDSKIKIKKVHEDDLSAWHGTANVDPYEKFDYNKVNGPGGEGAQAYGYGLYFTGKKAIAKWYRDKLSSVKSELFIDGKKASFHDNDQVNMLIARAWSSIDKELVKNKKVLTRELKNNKRAAFKEWKQRFDKAIEKVQTDSVVIKTNMGKIYHVDIPEDNEYLDWDKPFADQCEHVKSALENLFKKYKFEKFLEAAKKSDAGDHSAMKNLGFGLFDYPNAAGGLYEKMVSVIEEDKRIQRKAAQKIVSDELRSLGVPGIKYLAGGINNGGKPNKDDTYNYVIFDDSKIKIKKVHEWWEI